MVCHKVIERVWIGTAAHVMPVFACNTRWAVH